MDNLFLGNPLIVETRHGASVDLLACGASVDLLACGASVDLLACGASVDLLAWRVCRFVGVARL
ncbi:hypothetical protein [Scytonema sp. PRP1]|uniref:hypothetical protein n=1 Tax=Scytonema sp. PRP1 TaxID=3120513 RepID=UPI002FD63FAC